MFFEMRFDLGTLDSGEPSLPFGLLVYWFWHIRIFNGSEVRIENSVTGDNCSASLGKPRDEEQLSL